jgi:hypothetical protein
MSLERQALVLALESLRDLTREQHEMQINILALFKAYQPTSQSAKDPLMDQARVARQELARYDPDATIRQLTDMIQALSTSENL